MIISIGGKFLALTLRRGSAARFRRFLRFDRVGVTLASASSLEDSAGFGGDEGKGAGSNWQKR